MDFWPEFLANNWGREFVAGGFGGVAGIISGYPLDSLRVRQQLPNSGTALTILKRVLKTDGPMGLYKGMAAPLASVTFQNAMVFQTYAVLCKALEDKEPPSYRTIGLAGFGTGALQSLMLSPVELVKIRLQLQKVKEGGPIEIARKIMRREGIRGIYRGLTVTVLRDAPAHGLYFWTYERSRELLHPGCRKTGDESVNTMLLAGGLAGVASWVVCYPSDVIKTRLQSQTESSLKYRGILHCLRTSVREEGFPVLWRGLGTAVTRAFLVNGAIFSAYEIALRCLFQSNSIQAENAL